MTKIGWKLLGDRVLIKPDNPEVTTETGMIIPEFAREIPPEGLVVAVGPGYDPENHPMLVKEGDRAMYGGNAGVPVTVDKQEYLMMRELEIFMCK